MNYKLLSLALLLIIIACQPDNFDEIAEEALPYEPVILEEGNQISLRFREKETNHEQGYGVVVKSFGDDAYHLSSDTIVVCETTTTITDNGITETNTVLARFSKFYVNFYIGTNGEIYGSHAYITELSNQNERSTFYGGFPFTPKCSQDYPIIVNIEEKTSELIRGTFEAEFFQSVADSLIAPAPDNCADWESVGILRAAFAVPLTICE